jgi:hypothetical protein
MHIIAVQLQPTRIHEDMHPMVYNWSHLLQAAPLAQLATTVARAAVCAATGRQHGHGLANLAGGQALLQQLLADRAAAGVRDCGKVERHELN